ncbi:hypothetical protein ACFFMN_23260 [Planobispora siamensis]|uniref:Uncharacterized protein n=1 Tax=Planobispora siamensis TaxID=936338 RepID=A0A8J3WPW5_9ACTN|nr:hypothetical protein [Planobispora siamensis]GIH95281.1 hypothetical protein Psi01_59110 [Planobispora siamensis]
MGRYYNHRDRVAAFQRGEIAREMAAAGHDAAAAERAGRLAALDAALEMVESGDFPAETKQRARQIHDTDAAEIRAAGPVGCTCPYWRCVESRPGHS